MPDTSTAAEPDVRTPEPADGLPAPDGLTTSGLARFIDRALSVGCLLAVIPALVAGYEQLGHLHKLWLFLFGGALVASAALMPLYAWGRRGIRPITFLFAAAIMLGLLSWPLAWTSDQAATAAPVVALLCGFGTVCMGLAASTASGVTYGLVAAVAVFVVRLTLGGGAASPLVALSEALTQAILPLAVLYCVQFVRQSVQRTDERLAREHAQTVDAAVDRVLVAERRRLDAVVHDEVLTTLVAAARSSDGADTGVAVQARQALAALDAEEEVGDSDAPVSAEQLVRLTKNVVAGVCPRAVVLGEIPGSAVTVPSTVARALLQSTREAALNAEKHSGAENVQVLVVVTSTDQRVAARVSITDDGRGFDVTAVPEARLGVRLSLKARMGAAGGGTEVQSTPGRGTTVRLRWEGPRPRPVRPIRRSLANITQHPLFKGVDAPPAAGILAAATAVCVLLGGLASASAGSVGLLVAGVVVAASGLIFGLRGLGRLPQKSSWSWALAACAVAVTVLGLLAAPAGRWPDQATWFTAPVVMLLMLAYTGGHRLPAWAGALASAIVVLMLAGPQQPSRLLLTAAMPAAWVALVALSFGWYDTIWAEIDEADHSAAEAAHRDAVAFGKVVLREVWLAELKEEVGPILTRLATSPTPLTDAERRRLLLLEGSLRDGIKAANFNSPTLSAAIMDARFRGVEVTLVDNRGGRLPEKARRAALAKLDAVIRSASSGRIIARRAPEGYEEAVTILVVDADGTSHLTRIGNDGHESDGRTPA